VSSPSPSPGLRPRLGEDEKRRLQTLSPSNRFAKDGGYAMVPHRILNIQCKVSGHAQLILIQAIIHATFGAPNNPEWALMKLTSLAAKSRYGRKAFELAADDAAKRGLIERCKHGRCWFMKVVPEDWDSVADYVPPHEPPLILIQGGRQRDPVSGRFYLDRRVAMSELHVADPAACQFELVIKTAMPVDVSLEVQKYGLISVVVSDSGTSATPSEDAKTPASAPKVHRLFTSALTPIFLKTFKKTPDSALISQIVALVAGAPPEMLLERIEEKCAAGTLKSPGLVLNLARDVGVAWRGGAELRAAAELDQAERDDARASAEADAAEFGAVIAEIGGTLEDFRRITDAQALAETRAIASGRLKPRP
jgi:hypothetical protein